jgi:hypothetical protein
MGISFATTRIQTCDKPVFWAKGTAERASQSLEFTLGVPVLERFKDVRLGVVVIGPGLAALSDPNGIVPAEISGNVGADEGAVLYESPADQSTCAHLASEEMQGASEVTEGRCRFFETYGESHSWVLMDQALITPQAGEYRFAIWVTTQTTAKFWFACCDWPEDFVTDFDMPIANCPYCGTKETFGQYFNHFYEQKVMAEHGGFPLLQDCTADSSAPALPAEDQCPDETAFAAMVSDACILTCVGGECHSTNIFGACKYDLEWVTPQAMLNGEVVTKMTLFKGDQLSFKKPAAHAFSHNLIQFDTLEKFTACDIDHGDGDMVIGNVNDVNDGTGGALIVLTGGTHYFSCGISNHCVQGQKLEVVVKDASDGMHCHADHRDATYTANSVGGGRRLHAELGGDDHEHDEHEACPEGEVQAYILRDADFGAHPEFRCAEICQTEERLKGMPFAKRGSCERGGYPRFEREERMQPSGFPMKVNVRIYQSPFACHCHSYEEIKCGAEGDDLYQQHVDEITTHCAGVVAGTDTVCPYLCFASFEVLHLYYMECSTRPVHELYTQIEATNICHKAAAPPAGTECEGVTTPAPTQAPPDSDALACALDPTKCTESHAAAALLLGAVLVH